MKLIPISNSEKQAIIDDEDYPLVSQYKWSLDGRGYPRACINRKQILLHRLVTNAQPGTEIDHINQDRFDARKSNLRSCSSTQNHANTGPRKRNKTGKKGVCWDEKRQKFESKLRYQGQTIHLGRFVNLDEAARAYDVAALAYFGDFAKTNFPEETYK